MDTANAARAPPKTSSGSVYMFTLNAATAKKLSEIPAVAQAAEGAAGMAAVASESVEAARHARKRAAGAGTPRATQRHESEPPANPPRVAATGGIHAYHAACTNVRWRALTRYLAGQLVQSEYRSEERRVGGEC